MGIDFYYMPLSAPCRAVHMTAKEYDIGLTYKIVNLKAKEQLQSDFLNINPLHLLPTIDDNGFRLWESSAIMTYFANKYGPKDNEDPLYPKDLQIRAKVDRILHFYSGTLYPAFYNHFIPQIFDKRKPTAAQSSILINALNDLDSYLTSNNNYLVGKHRTLADISVLATVVSIENFEYDLSAWPRIVTWMKLLKTELPYYSECNDEGLKDHKQMFLLSK